MPSRDARAQGIRSEHAAARKYGLDVIGETCDWADLRAPNGTRYSCKSAVHTRAGGGPGTLRFRRRHLNRLARHHQAAVVVVLLPSEDTASTRPLKIEKVSLQDARDAIDHWYPGTEHYEVPWPELIDY